MMGLYIFEGGITRPERGAWLKEPRFVPTGDVDEIIDEIPRPEGYIIMPSTYENNIRGPFVISVSSQNEFTLNRMDEE
jgi:hypothetical protein